MTDCYLGVTRDGDGDIVVAVSEGDGEVVEEVGSTPAEAVEQVRTIAAGRPVHLCVDGTAANGLDLALAFGRLPSAEVFVMLLPKARGTATLAPRHAALDLARRARRAL
jgi:hypothetical protein